MGLLNLSPEQIRLLTLQLISLLGFASLNIGLNFYNSWVLKKGEGDGAEAHHALGPHAIGHYHQIHGAGPEFTFPVFYTMFHMVASVLGAGVVMAFKRPTQGYPSFAQLWDYRAGLVPIAICTTCNIGFNNISLTLISLFLNQVIKATGPLPTMLFSFVLERKTYTWLQMGTCGAIVMGTILAIPIVSGGTPTSGAGVIVVIISTVAASLKPVIMALVLQGTAERPKLEPTVVLFYDCFLSFWFMLIYWLASAERAASIAYIGEKPGVAAAVIAGGATMAFVFNLSTYFFVLLTSALTSTVASNGVKVVNIVISALVSHVSDTRNWIGVATVSLSILAYAYAGHAAKKAAPKAADAPFLKKDAEKGLKASESTPLTPGPADNTQCCVIS